MTRNPDNISTNILSKSFLLTLKIWYFMQTFVEFLKLIMPSWLRLYKDSSFWDQIRRAPSRGECSIPKKTLRQTLVLPRRVTGTIFQMKFWHVPVMKYLQIWLNIWMLSTQICTCYWWKKLFCELSVGLKFVWFKWDLNNDLTLWLNWFFTNSWSVKSNSITSTCPGAAGGN